MKVISYFILLLSFFHFHNSIAKEEVKDNSAYDYYNSFGKNFVRGWTDGIQITCGIANSDKDTEIENYFDIYEQIYDFKKPTINGPTPFWNFTFSTQFPKNKTARFNFKTSDGLNVTLPDRQKTGLKPQKLEVFNAEVEGCVLESDCVYRQSNVMMMSIANDANESGNIQLNIISSDYSKSIKIEGIRGFKRELDKCFKKIELDNKQ